MPRWVKQQLYRHFAAPDAAGSDALKVWAVEDGLFGAALKQSIQHGEGVTRPPALLPILAPLQAVQLIHHDHRHHEVNVVVPDVKQLGEDGLFQLLRVLDVEAAVSDNRPTSPFPQREPSPE